MAWVMLVLHIAHQKKNNGIAFQMVTALLVRKQGEKITTLMNSKSTTTQNKQACSFQPQKQTREDTDVLEANLHQVSKEPKAHYTFVQIYINQMYLVNVMELHFLWKTGLKLASVFDLEEFWVIFWLDWS